MSNPNTARRFSFVKIIATTDGTTEIIAGVTGRKLVIEKLVVCVTTAAAQAFTIDDGTITIFSAPASLAVGTYGIDCGDGVGKELTSATALSYTATAGCGLTVSGYGYLK